MEWDLAVTATSGDNPHSNRDLPTWNDFTQNTTLHGIRYIFDKDGIRFRR